MTHLFNIKKMLPAVEQPAPYLGKRVFSTENNDYKELCDLIIHHVEADCWAFVVNDEPLWNTYQNNRSYKARLLAEIMRNAVIKDPHSILCELHREIQNSQVEIFMFGDNPWKLILDYNSQLQTYTITKKVS